MTSRRCMAVSTPAYLECQICFDTWTHPVQLLSCGHIFCAECARRNGKRCYICGADVEDVQPPSESIVRQAEEVQVVCGGCGWRGTRKAAETHVCGERAIYSEMTIITTVVHGEHQPLLAHNERVSE